MSANNNNFKHPGELNKPIL